MAADELQKGVFLARASRSNTIDFAEIASTIADTHNGQEASMYPRLFELFVHFLG